VDDPVWTEFLNRLVSSCCKAGVAFESMTSPSGTISWFECNACHMKRGAETLDGKEALDAWQELTKR
jgi:hypothetical protein